LAAASVTSIISSIGSQVTGRVTKPQVATLHCSHPAQRALPACSRHPDAPTYRGTWSDGHNGLRICRGLPQKLGRDFSVRNWRQNVLYCSNLGHETLPQAGACPGARLHAAAARAASLPRCCRPRPRCFAHPPPSQVFAGAMGALAAMTVLSALLGWAAPNLVSCLRSFAAKRPTPVCTKLQPPSSSLSSSGPCLHSTRVARLRHAAA
jgi:hypothetical protein